MARILLSPRFVALSPLKLRATGGRATAAATTTVAAAGSDAVLASIDAAASAASTAAAARPAIALIGEEAFLQTKVRLEKEAGLDTSAAQSALDAFLQSEGFGSEIPGATSTGIPGAAATFAPAATAAPATATITATAAGSGAVLASIDAAASAASTAAAARPAIAREEAFLQTKVRLEKEAGLDTSVAQSALNAFLQSEGFGSEIPGATSTGIPGVAATFATCHHHRCTCDCYYSPPRPLALALFLASIDAAASAASTAAAAAQQSLVDSAPPRH
ncbi:hypothetical protein B0H14DRAFT_3871574 [Mycena olivaceomarginata]|nr:hypothetical protein B0H14DRAFT_3871574 [Mycena olivaceomarginata]